MSSVRLFWRILVASVTLVAIGLLATFVWPTRYRYDHVSVGGSTFPVRFDRLTGRGELFSPYAKRWLSQSPTGGP